MESKSDLSKSRLSHQEVKLVQVTYRLISDSGEMASDFYNRLFFKHPELRPLFKENIHFQANKFATLIFYLIHNIHNSTQIMQSIDEFKKEYIHSELTSRHYVFVREAFFYSLKQHLKRQWTAEAEGVWKKFYRMITEVGASLADRERFETLDE